MRFMSDFREAMWGVVQQADLRARLRLRGLRDTEHFERLEASCSAVSRDRGSRAVVVIGGGVGGCAILYWLTQLGWDDVVLVERADLTSGSTFHSAGLVGQLRGSLSLTKMMMSSVELYRTLGDEVGLETGWHEVGSLRLASSEERMEELARQAGWAKTFGLPLELVSAEEAQRLFPPMSTDGVLGAAYLPTDGYIDPSQLTFALAEGARRGGAEIEHEHARHRRSTSSAAASAASRPTRAAIETEIVVNAGGMFAAEIGALAGVVVPVVPMAHEYLDHAPGRPPARPADDARPLAARLLPRRVRRPRHGRLRARPGAVGARRHPAGLQRPAARRGLGALRGADEERDRPRADARGRRGRPARSTARRRSRRTASSSSARPTCAASGSPPASARTASRAPAAWGSSSPSGSSRASRASTCGRWTRAASAATTRAASTRSRARVEVYSTYYDVKYPGHERAGRPAAPPLPHLPAARGARRRLRREVGLGARELVRAERGRAATSRCARAAGRAASGRRRSAPSTARRARRPRSSTRRRSRRSRSSGAGAADFLERLCDNRVARDVGAITYTSMLNERGGIECDFTVTRLAEDRFRIVTGTAFGRHDLAWIRSHAPDDGSVRVEDVTSRFACLGIWGPRAREILQPLAGDRSTFPYMRARELAVGPVPCLALRVTYVGELGWELYCPTRVRPRGSGTRSGRRAGSTASSPAATGRSTPAGSRRATASGAPTSRPRTRPGRPGSASRSSSTRATSSAAKRSSRSASPSAASPASSSTTRARSRSAQSPCGSTATPSAG